MWVQLNSAARRATILHTNYPRSGSNLLPLTPALYFLHSAEGSEKQNVLIY